MNAASDGVHLLLDQGIPRDAAGLLRAIGFGCDHVAELGMSRAEDAQILEVARERKAVVVTLDADFHTMLAVSGAAGPSVIRLRLQGLDGAKVAALVKELVERFAQELADGSLVTAKPKKTTCHRLPAAAA